GTSQRIQVLRILVSQQDAWRSFDGSPDFAHIVVRVKIFLRLQDCLVAIRSGFGQDLRKTPEGFAGSIQFNRALLQKTAIPENLKPGRNGVILAVTNSR